MDPSGSVQLSNLAQDFSRFYEDRIAAGKPAERKPCIFTKGGYTLGDVEHLILSMPYKRFEDMGFMCFSDSLRSVSLSSSVMDYLTVTDIETLKRCCQEALARYFKE